MAILIRIFFLLSVLLWMVATSALADDNLQLQEQEIKAGLLYNFLKYTDWPAGAISNNAMTVCVLGDDSLEGYLKPMAERTVNQHAITIRHLHDIREAEGCHLLFLGAQAKDQWPELKKILSGKGILTVSDFAGFADAGGMIEFGHKNDHISADLNMNAVSAAQLHVQDRLLRLVTIMHPAGGQ